MLVRTAKNREVPKQMKLALLVLLATIVSACATSPIQQHLELVYKDRPRPCDVELMSSSHFTEVYKITCPGEEPFTKKYHKR